MRVETKVYDTSFRHLPYLLDALDGQSDLVRAFAVSNAMYESDFTIAITNGVGARGFFQFMKKTAEGLLPGSYASMARVETPELKRNSATLQLNLLGRYLQQCASLPQSPLMLFLALGMGPKGARTLLKTVSEGGKPLTGSQAKSINWALLKLSTLDEMLSSGRIVRFKEV